MGNCLPKQRKRRVESPVKLSDEIHEIISRSTEFKRPRSTDPEDMVKALKENGKKQETKEDSIKDQVVDEELTAEAVPAKKAESFMVDFQDNVPTAKMPVRLAKRLSCEENENESEIEYTDEEEQMMAEIMRDDMLNERKKRAEKEDIKRYDAKRKRMFFEFRKEKQLEMKLSSSSSNIIDQRKKVKAMADEDRKRAAEKKRAAEEQ